MNHPAPSQRAGSQPPATAWQATKTMIIGGGRAGLVMGYQRVLP
jgi:hypothetical protein